MSSDIWTQCEGRSELRRMRLTPWRVVESQHQIATRKLVDTLAEQALLEELIDGAKPPDTVKGGLHYLLSTPFRYPPLRNGSRFGSRHERGIWYGAETVATAMSEVAYYRFVFLAGTTAVLDRISLDLTAFRARTHTSHAVDLVSEPFAAYRNAVASPTSYQATQALGAAMRADGVQLCRFPSARDPAAGVNVAVFASAVFGRGAPYAFQNWRCTIAGNLVEMLRRDHLTRESMEFQRDVFLVNGNLPVPALM